MLRHRRPRGRLLPLAVAVILAAPLATAGSLSAFVDDEDGGELDPAKRHLRAPHDVSFEITDDDRLLAAGEDWAEVLFPRLDAEFPGRFSFDDDAEVWSDNRGEYVWDDDEEVYWQNVSAETLTRGRQDYVQFCASCHGLDGDGYGRSAQALRPPPRDFSQGLFKFTKVSPDYLPSDDALVHLIQEGLDGTPMFPWDVAEPRLRDVVQYIKSMSPEDEGWRDSTNDFGDPIDVGEDPWVGDIPAAVAEGERLYHANGCYNCHPGYLGAVAINAIQDKPADTAFRENITIPKRVEDSSYEVLGESVDIMVPDFTWHTMRRGRTPQDVARTIKAGIQGAGMPTWETFPDKTIWAIAHYVRHLTDEYHGQPAKRAAFMADVRAGH